jgi:hypothetical protein
MPTSERKVVLRRKKIAIVFLSVLTVLATLLVEPRIASADASHTASVDGSNVAMLGEPGPFRIESLYSRRCLRDEGYVFGFECSSTDFTQRWIFWNGGWIKNQATNRCIRAGNQLVWTEACDASNQRQLWTQVGSIIKLTNAFVCLHVVLGTAENIEVDPCDQIIGGNTHFWSVTYW